MLLKFSANFCSEVLEFLKTEVNLCKYNTHPNHCYNSTILENSL